MELCNNADALIEIISSSPVGVYYMRAKELPSLGGDLDVYLPLGGVDDFISHLAKEINGVKVRIPYNFNKIEVLCFGVVIDLNLSLTRYSNISPIYNFSEKELPEPDRFSSWYFHYIFDKKGFYGGSSLEIFKAKYDVTDINSLIKNEMFIRKVFKNKTAEAIKIIQCLKEKNEKFYIHIKEAKLLCDLAQKKSFLFYMEYNIKRIFYGLARRVSANEFREFDSKIKYSRKVRSHRT
jgi:hypothetical protein